MADATGSKIKYSLVLPSYLEEENLRLLIPRILDETRLIGEKWPGQWEIIVVDTAKPLDATEDVCRANGVVYVNRHPGNSFGDAVRTGIDRAQGEWIAFMDADGSHTPEFLHKLVAETAQSDIVIASRYVEGGYTENDRSLVLMSRILNVSYALILNLRCKDVSNSFKIYRASMLKGLDLKCQNFDIIEEILYKISRLNPGLRIKEVPFSFKKRMFGETKRNLVTFILTYVFTMVRLRFMRVRALEGGASKNPQS